MGEGGFKAPPAGARAVSVPLWLDPAPAPRPSLAEDASVDVLVVGLGMTGASAAWHAASRGLSTLALDAGVAAGAASGRNAGYLLAGPEAYYASTVAAYGRERARDVWDLNRANRDDVVRLAERLPIDCAYRRTGSVMAAVSKDEAATLVASHDLLREDGHEVLLLDGRATDARLAGRGFVAGLLTPADGCLHPAAFVRGLADAAERAGARLHERTPVTSLARDGDRWVARTARGTVRARTVVAGLNAYAPELLEFARERVFPVRGQVLATAPVADAPPLPVYADHGYLYVRSFGDRVVAGGMRPLARSTEVGTDDIVNAAVQAAVEAAVARHWPQAAGAEVTHRWSGIMGFSRDGLPWIGAVPGSPGLLAAFGYTGHGWGYGVAAGGWLTDLAEGKEARIPSWCATDRPLVMDRVAV